MMSLLERSSTNALQSNDIPSALLCASYYAILEKFRSFEQIFRDRLVIPFCERVINQKYLEDLLKSGSNKPGLVSLFDIIIEFMSMTVITWIEPLSDVTCNAGQMYVDLLVQPVLEKIITDLPIIFSPGIPDAFQHAYVASHDFLRQVQDIIPEANIGECAAMKLLQKSWQINIYYQLRFRDIATIVEDSLEIQLPMVSFSHGSAKICLDQVYQFKSLKKALEEMWSDHMIISPLIAKFFKLTLQTCARFIDWLVSIPSDFDGTELGLSTLVVKFCQLHNLPHLLDGLLQTSILTHIDVEEHSVFRGVIDRFMSTKCQDAKTYLEGRLLKSSVLLLQRSYQQQMKKGHKSCRVILHNFFSAADFVEPKLLATILRQVAESFVSDAKVQWELSFKITTNIRRLESVMKAPPSPEDQMQFEVHEALKKFLKAEAAHLSELASTREIDSDDAFTALKIFSDKLS